MTLRERIPDGFYKLFATKYMDYYMILLVALHQESNLSYSSLGLTEHECRAIINENLLHLNIEWEDEEEEESDPKIQIHTDNAQRILARLTKWGWLRKDYDDKLNCDVLSFPEYSQLYVELFEKLFSADDSKERESILAIYSYLFTYQADKEKNNDILKSARKTSKRLEQLLSNMQDGMRAYFDELSRQKNFRGIQEVLINEINNSDSQKYAILTTTDSFYRYKEAVKELIDQILSENDKRKYELERKQVEYKEGSTDFLRNARAMELCDEATEVVCQIERGFDVIERKYNRLIEQKTIFASRAVARIRYILQEGMNEEDNTIALINLLSKSEKKEGILQELMGKMRFSRSFAVMSEHSFYTRRTRVQNEFEPQAISPEHTAKEDDMENFIIKPLYTRRQIRAFMEKNTEHGVFTATKDTVHSVEDLEKLMFVWQNVTGNAGSKRMIELEKEVMTKEGFVFSGLVIEEEQHD